MNRVKAAFFAFISVPDPKDHARYNWWHSADHIAENMTLPGVCYGARYVAAPGLIAARSAVAPELAPAQYLVTYYIDGEPPERIIQQHHELNRRLREAGRDFPGRKVHFIAPFDYDRGRVAPRLEVPPEALLWRPHTGIFIAMADVLDTAHAQEIDRWFDEVHFPDLLTIKGFTGVWRFVSRGGVYAGFANPPERFLHIYFLDEDPEEAMADMRIKQARFAAAGRALGPSQRRVVFTGAFRSIVHKQYDWFEQRAAAPEAARR